LTSYAQELKALLDALEVNSSVVLVGHSFGASIVRNFAARYSSALDIKAIVLVDGLCENMILKHSGLNANLSTSVARLMGTIMGRLPVLRCVNAIGMMWKMVVSHPGSEILVKNPVAAKGIQEMGDRLIWPHTTQTMMAEVSRIKDCVRELSLSQKDPLGQGNRPIISVVAELSVGMLVAPNWSLFPSWLECQRELTATLNQLPDHATLNENLFRVVKNSNHTSILASPEVVQAVLEASS
jgi:pimeloyl-ACP methyl ester carboxylesterase